MCDVSRTVIRNFIQIASDISGIPLPFDMSDLKIVQVISKEQMIETEKKITNVSYDTGDLLPGGIFFYDDECEIYILHDQPMDAVVTALVHELTHYLQFKDGWDMSDTYRIERSAYITGSKYLDQLGLVPTEEIQEIMKQFDITSKDYTS